MKNFNQAKIITIDLEEDDYSKFERRVKLLQKYFNLFYEHIKSILSILDKLNSELDTFPEIVSKSQIEISSNLNILKSETDSILIGLLNSLNNNTPKDLLICQFNIKMKQIPKQFEQLKQASNNLFDYFDSKQLHQIQQSLKNTNNNIDIDNSTNESTPIYNNN